MGCSQCGHDNTDGAKFCNECGARLEPVCPACTSVNPPGSKFCNECGVSLSARSQPQVSGSQPVAPSTQAEAEAEACFLKAIEIAQQQQAKSLELRAVTSLARLRQQQATQDVSRTTHHAPRVKLDEAHRMLAEVYHWFTEGFDTKDLQEAKGLLAELAGE